MVGSKTAPWLGRQSRVGAEHLRVLPPAMFEVFDVAFGFFARPISFAA